MGGYGIVLLVEDDGAGRVRRNGQYALKCTILQTLGADEIATRYIPGKDRRGPGRKQARLDSWGERERRHTRHVAR